MQTRLKGNCAIPVGWGPETAPFEVIGLPFFFVDDGDEFPPVDDDEPFPDSWPLISAGEARFDTGPPGKVYGAPRV